jgi:hypothetical protein
MIAFLSAGLVAGCTKSSEPTAPKRLSEAELSAEQEAQLTRAKAAQGELFQRLLKELTGALDAGGPASAISVCRDKAPEIAKEVSEKNGLKIGRTSFRLRNPKNVPPTWAAGLVEEKVSKPAFVPLGGDALGVLLPIQTAPPCLKCHGEAESLAADVREEISKAYPSDQATGFSAGDLRGWFWIEVPSKT